MDSFGLGSRTPHEINHAVASSGGTTQPQSAHLDLTRPISICSKTAVRWLHALGMDYVEYSVRLYFDCHERTDVVNYREEFLKRMSVPTALDHGERPGILMTHDESCLGSHDGNANDRPLLPKGQGALLWSLIFSVGVMDQ